MVGQILESATGGSKGVIELIVRIVHLIDTEHSFQTALVKGLVVSNKGKSLNQRLYLRPYLWKNRSIVSIFMTEAMNLTAPVVIIVWLRLNERVERIYNLTIANNDDSYRAYAATLIVSRFKIYCCKVFHFFVMLGFALYHSLQEQSD